MIRRLGLLAALLALFATSAWALAVPKAPSGRLNDYSGLLKPAEASAIEARLKAIEDASSNQFTVAVFKSLEGDSMEDFSIRLFDAWKVGHKGRDNGLILLLFMDERKIRIEVGKGLEGAITDALSGRVIREVMAPRFREGDFAGGLLASIDALDQASRGEFKALPRKAKGEREGQTAGKIVFVILMAVFFLATTVARNRSAHIGGRRHGGLFFFPFFWGGGGFGGRGGFGGGGGFSGFSGGGGMGGGGGASGGW